MFFTYNTLDWAKLKTIFLLSFFVCLCYGRRTHTHPMLEKPSAQNIAEYENQGQQNEN